MQRTADHAARTWASMRDSALEPSAGTVAEDSPPAGRGVGRRVAAGGCAKLEVCSKSDGGGDRHRGGGGGDWFSGGFWGGLGR